MGRIFRPGYTVTGPDGARERRQVKRWHVEYTDETGRTRRRVGGTREQARDLLRKLEGDVLAAKSGMGLYGTMGTKVLDLAEAYLHSHRTRVTPQQAGLVRQRLMKMIQRMGAYYVRDVTPDRVEKALAELFDVGLGPVTTNKYGQALAGMFNWSVQTRKIAFNPVQAVAKLPEHDLRRRRRALTLDEARRLLEAAATGPERRMLRKLKRRLTLAEEAAAIQRGHGIAMAYGVMLAIGLRANEARTLRWHHVDLEACMVTVEAVNAKNRRQATLPLPATVAEALRDYRARWRGEAGDPVFPLPAHLIKAFNEDLRAAGIAKRDAAGRTLDVHCLRHTYATELARTGVDVKTLQHLMRHSTPRMALVYVHSSKAAMRAAVEALPRFDLAPDRPAEAIKTGTDDVLEPPRTRQGLESSKPKSLPSKDLDHATGACSPASPAYEHAFATENGERCQRLPTAAKNCQTLTGQGVTGSDGGNAPCGVKCQELPETAKGCTGYRQGLAKVCNNEGDLAQVVAAWPTLPAEVREQILALVEEGSR